MSEDWRARVPPLSDAFHAAYRLEGLLGEGGMGAVYRAHQVALGRDVAVKLLKGYSEADAARFAREGRVLASLRHPAIMAAFDSGIDSNVPYLVCELLDGETLHARKKRERPTLDASLAIVRDMAAALAHAHSEGVVHRDVKPENVFIFPDGSIKLTDFGLARETASGQTVTAAGVVLGTPGYIAPEQLEGARPDPATDQYALGVVAFELITGGLPFQGPSPAEVAFARLRVDAPRISERCPTVPAEVEALVARALQRRPADRFESIAAMGAAFELARSHLGPAGAKVHRVSVRVGGGSPAQGSAGRPADGAPARGAAVAAKGPAAGRGEEQVVTGVAADRADVGAAADGAAAQAHARVGAPSERTAHRGAAQRPTPVHGTQQAVGGQGGAGLGSGSNRRPAALQPAARTASMSVVQREHGSPLAVSTEALQISGQRARSSGGTAALGAGARVTRNTPIAPASAGPSILPRARITMAVVMVAAVGAGVLTMRLPGHRDAALARYSASSSVVAGPSGAGAQASGSESAGAAGVAGANPMAGAGGSTGTGGSQPPPQWSGLRVASATEDVEARLGQWKPLEAFDRRVANGREAAVVAAELREIARPLLAELERLPAITGSSDAAAAMRRYAAVMRLRQVNHLCRVLKLPGLDLFLAHPPHLRPDVVPAGTPLLLADASSSLLAEGELKSQVFFYSPSDTFIGLSPLGARCGDVFLRFECVGSGEVHDADVYLATLEQGTTKHELMLERTFDPERPRSVLTHSVPHDLLTGRWKLSARVIRPVGLQHGLKSSEVSFKLVQLHGTLPPKLAAPVRRSDVPLHGVWTLDTGRRYTFQLNDHGQGRYAGVLCPKASGTVEAWFTTAGTALVHITYVPAPADREAEPHNKDIVAELSWQPSRVQGPWMGRGMSGEPGDATLTPSTCR